VHVSPCTKGGMPTARSPFSHISTAWRKLLTCTETCASLSRAVSPGGGEANVHLGTQAALQQGSWKVSSAYWFK
jgi:hypothetical protein